MRKGKYAILCGAAVAALPIVSKAAVTITYSYDLADIAYSTGAGFATFTLASAGPAGTLTGTSANPTLTIPAGDFFRIGLDVTVTGDTVASDGVSGEPAHTLGVAAYQTGIAASNASVGSVNPIGQTAGAAIAAVLVNADFTGSTGTGKSDGAGGVNSTLGTIGSNSFNGLAYNTKMSYGGGVANEVYNNLKFKANGSAGQSSTFTLTNNSSAFQYVVKQAAATGTGSSQAATYKNQTFIPGTDSFGAMPVLTLVIAGGATTSAGGTNKIISLATTASTGTAPNGYGNAALGTLNPVNGHQVSVNISGGAAVGFVNDLVGSPVYALRVAIGGVELLPTDSRLQLICNDINASESGIGTAKPVLGSSWSALFPGYDILVPKTGVGDPAFEFDFTGATDTGATQGVTVTSIAAVPEPATAAGVVLGAAGLLLGRRKKRLEVA